MKPRSIRLPEDTSPHDTIIEWWYFNGFLEDAHGGDGRYAFMDCLFRANVDKVNIPYFKNIFARGKAGRYALFAHSMLADIGAGDGSGTRRAAKDVQNISLASRDTFKHPLFYANYIDPVSVAGGFVRTRWRKSHRESFISRQRPSISCSRRARSPCWKEERVLLPCVAARVFIIR